MWGDMIGEVCRRKLTISQLGLCAGASPWSCAARASAARARSSAATTCVTHGAWNPQCTYVVEGARRGSAPCVALATTALTRARSDGRAEYSWWRAEAVLCLAASAGTCATHDACTQQCT